MLDFYIDYTGDIDCGGTGRYIVWTYLNDEIAILSKHNSLKHAILYMNELEVEYLFITEINK